MIDPLIREAIAFAIAVLFASAALHKIDDRHRFVAALRDYQLMPEWMIRPVSILIPPFELFLAAFWVTGFRNTALIVASSALLAVYALAIAINLHRGRIYIDCGCNFGRHADDAQGLSWGLVFRNLLLIAVTLVLLLPATARTLKWPDFLVIAITLMISIILYSGAGQLMKNRAAINTWRNR